MAKASEGFAWLLFPGSKKECWKCHRALKVADVGLHRQKYPGGKTEFLCKECQKKGKNQ